jgi:hypothetical protein
VSERVGGRAGGQGGGAGRAFAESAIHSSNYSGGARKMFYRLNLKQPRPPPLFHSAGSADFLYLHSTDWMLIFYDRLFIFARALSLARINRPR